MHIPAALSFPLTFIVKGLRQLTKTSVDLADSAKKIRYQHSGASSDSFFNVKQKRFLGVSYHRSGAPVPNGDIKNIGALSFRSFGVLRPAIVEKTVEAKPQPVVQNRPENSSEHPEVDNREDNGTENENHKSLVDEKGVVEGMEEGNYARLDFILREERVESEEVDPAASALDPEQAKSTPPEGDYAIPERLRFKLTKAQNGEDVVEDTPRCWKPVVIDVVMKANPVSKDNRDAVTGLLTGIAIKNNHAVPFVNFKDAMREMRRELLRTESAWLAKKMNKKGAELWQSVEKCDEEYEEIYSKEFRTFFFDQIRKTAFIAESVNEILCDAHRHAADKAGEEMRVSGREDLKNYETFLYEVAYAKEALSALQRARRTGGSI